LLQQVMYLSQSFASSCLSRLLVTDQNQRQQSSY